MESKMQERLRELSYAVVPGGCESEFGKGSRFLLAQASTSFLRREFLNSGEKQALDAARAVWLERFGSLRLLPEIMTEEQCRKALKVDFDILK